jgi:O-antigen/teichoic acid export membrane protein
LRKLPHPAFAFGRLVSSAVSSQAVLSAASFLVGLILIRRTSDVQYGFYVLAINAIILIVSLQGAFFNPPLAIRLNKLDRLGRGELVGGLYREQRRVLPGVAVTAILGALGLWYMGLLDAQTGPLVIVTAVATLATLHREYFRMVLFANRRPQDVLRTDVLYVLLMVGGVWLATRSAAPATIAVLAVSLAAALSGFALSRTFHRREPWNLRGRPGILREIAPLAAWATAGAAIHWTFSQGYTYLVAGTLDVAAVAALAGTRLLLMPVNLLSMGVGSLMLPFASGWLHQHGTPTARRRLWISAAVLGAAALCYTSVLWWFREWIFTVILHKQFVHRDELLLLWCAIFLVVVMRDQMNYLLAAQGRFRSLTLLTLGSALVSLAASYLAILRFGVPGALMGMLVGESISAVGTLMLSFRVTALPVAAAA